MSELTPGSTEWAAAQQRKAARLQEEGEDKACPETLHRAVEAHQNALSGYPLEAFPDEFADIQYDLAITYWALLDLADDPASSLRLRAEEAFEEALKGLDPKRNPEAWARTQYNFGIFLRLSGTQQNNPNMFKRAVTAYRFAMESYAEQDRVEDWCRAAHNTAIALNNLAADLNDGTAHLFEASELLGQVLKEPAYTDDPQSWAMSQVVYGTSSQMLGERRENEALMERALAAYNAALTVRTRQTTPVEWANTLAQKGISLQTLGHRRKDIDLTKEAIAAYRAALTVRTPEDNLLGYAITQTNLGNALSTLGWLKEDKSILKEAIAAHTLSVNAFAEANDPREVTLAEDNRRKAEKRLELLAQ